MLHFLVLPFVALGSYCVFYTVKVCSNLVLSSLGAVFPNSIPSLRVSVSYFRNPHKISNLPIIKLVMVICDQ